MKTNAKIATIEKIRFEFEAALNFPNAIWRLSDGTQKPVTVWCGNDYLGMGQNPIVINAIHEALDATGAGSGGAKPPRSWLMYLLRDLSSISL